MLTHGRQIYVEQHMTGSTSINTDRLAFDSVMTRTSRLNAWCDHLHLLSPDTKACSLELTTLSRSSKAFRQGLGKLIYTTIQTPISTTNKLQLVHEARASLALRSGDVHAWDSLRN